MASSRGQASKVTLIVLFLLFCGVVLPPQAGAAQPSRAMDRSWGASENPDVAEDPAALRAEVEQVLSDPEFSYKKSLFERFVDWLATQIDNLFPDIGTPSGPGASFSGGIGTLLAWVIIAAALAAAIAAIVYSIARRVRTPKKDREIPTETVIEHRRSAAAWDSDAERHESSGEWKEALRDRYRSLIRQLIDSRQLPDIPGRTCGELCADLAKTTPEASAEFHEASLLFELAWYADIPTGPAENSRFRVAAQAVLAARVLQDGRKNTSAERPLDDAVQV